MDVSIAGIALNPQTLTPSPFVLSFDISGGTLETAGCQSALMSAAVNHFTAEVGNNVQDLPASFAANVTTTPYPTCGDLGFGELVGGPLTLESQGPLLVQHSRLFDGNIGSWYIETAQLTILPAADPASTVPEPGMWVLLAVAALTVVWRWRPVLRSSSVPRWSFQSNNRSLLSKLCREIPTSP